MNDNDFSKDSNFLTSVKNFFLDIYYNKRLFYSIIAVVSVLVCVTLTVTVIYLCRHEHKFESKVTIEPGCETEGELVYACKCGETEGEPIVLSPLGHKFIVGECTFCHKTFNPFEVSKLEFVIDGQVVEQYSAEAYCDDFKVSLKINGGEDMSEYIAPKITWSFLGESYGSQISQDGVVSLADFIGSITICVTVESENSLSASLPIKVVPGGTVIESISVTLNEGYDQYYIEGESFDKNSITLWGEHKDGVIRICDFDVNQKILTPEDTDFTIIYGDIYTDLPIVVDHKSLQSIEIVAPPTRTEYLEDQTFDREGLVIKANYENSSEVVTDFEVDEESALTVSTNSVLISYTHNGKTETVRQSITVVPKTLVSISVNATGVRKIYTQGDVFNPDGLVVKAFFESYGEVEIFDYSYTEDILLPDRDFVEIAYTAREITKTARVDISVIKPYSKITKLKVLSPTDVSITWSYSYLTDGGERIIDNTAYEANGLAYDRINGLYEIPLGAVVTATIRNPGVINVSLNGIEQTMDHIEKTVTWTMGSADLVVIKSIEMASSHSVIRFAEQENEQSFLFEGLWNGLLTQENLDRLLSVFADTDDYYHTYLIGGESFRFNELGGILFDRDSTVTVIRNANTTDSKELLLHLGEDSFYAIRLENDATVNDLPIFTKSGYNYLGWSLTPGSEAITDESLKELLSKEQDTYELYVIWEKETVDYSDKFLNPGDGSPSYGSGNTGSSGGSSFLPSTPDDDDPTYGGSLDGPPSSGGDFVVRFIGDWEFVRTVEEDGQIWKCCVTFLADGSFDYVVTVNDKINTHYYGTYRLTDDLDVIVLSVETDMDIILLDVSYFYFRLEENNLFASLIVSTGDSLVIGSCPLTKIIENDDEYVEVLPPIQIM